MAKWLLFCFDSEKVKKVDIEVGLFSKKIFITVNVFPKSYDYE